MRTIFTLALFLIVGFAGSRIFSRRSRSGLPLPGLFATGMEFFLLGMLLGPRGLGLISGEVLSTLDPIVYLALGWIGLLFGIELSWEHVRRISRSIIDVLLIDTFASLALVGTVSLVMISWLWSETGGRDGVVAAVVLGIAAAVSSPTVIALVSQHLPARGPFTNAVKTAGALSSLFPLIAFGFVFMLIHPRFFAFSGIAYGLLWWVFVNVVGFLLGFLMVLFTHERTSDDEMLLLIVGTVFLIGGICYFLGFSSLYTGLVMGFVVGNFSRKSDQIFRELHRVEKTIFIGFLLVVGSQAAVPDMGIAIVTVVYVLARLLVKFLFAGGVLSMRLPEAGSVGYRSGLAFSGQGVMAIAIALDCALAWENPALDRVLSVVAFAVLINATGGYWVTGRVLRSSGEAVAPRSRVTRGTRSPE